MNQIKTLVLAAVALLVAGPALAANTTAGRAKKPVPAHHPIVKKAAAKGPHKTLKKAVAAAKARRKGVTLRPTSLKGPVDTTLINATAIGPSLQPKTVQRMEAGLRLPKGSAPLGRYVRFYTIEKAGAVDDLPVTTVRDDVNLPEGRTIVVGVLVLPSLFREARLGPPGARIVAKSEMGQFFHGGCAVVNVVYDPAARRTVGTWCNYEDRLNPPPIDLE